ncbi:MAG: DUF115 domain-containing protein [Tepidisphaeraceae bacterium]
MSTLACPSERFVAKDIDSPLLKNLAALWLGQPAVARAVEGIESFDPVAVTLAKDGQPTASAPGVDGKPIQLHSRYRPVEEATKLIDAAPQTGIAAYFVLGFGLGHHVKALYDRFGDTVRIWIFEPDLRVLRAAIEHVDLSDVFASGRVKLVHELDRTDLTKQFTQDGAALAAGNAYVEHAPSVQRCPQFFEQTKVVIADLLSHCRTQINTIVLNARHTAENIARNLPLYLSTPGLDRLANAFEKKPAIIVSAGPSLRKNKHLLAAVRDNAVLISVQTTLQIMLDMGVEPHFVTSIDYHEICRKFYLRVPKTCRTELVAEPKATDQIFDVFPGPVSMLGNDFAEELLRELKLKKTKLRAGATVAHLAFYLAEYMGCDPIIFVGQDLGFSDGLCYTPGTAYDDVWRPELGRFCTVEQKQWEQIARDKPILRRTFDQRGRPTFSEERLFSYLQQFERDFAMSRARIIDATEGGVVKRGATVMKLTDALAQFCAQPLDRAVPAYGPRDQMNMPRAIECLQNRRAEAERVADLARQTLPLVEEVRDYVEDQARVNRAIAKIDPIRARMNELGKTYELAMSLSQKSEFDRFQADVRIGASKLDGAELQRRQAARDVDNVKSVIRAAEDLASLVNDAIARIEVALSGPEAA